MRVSLACVVLLAACIHAHKIGDRVLNGHFEIIHVSRGEEMPEHSHLTRMYAETAYGSMFDISPERAPLDAMLQEEEQTSGMNEAGQKIAEVGYRVPYGYEPFPNIEAPHFRGAGSFGAVFLIKRVDTEEIYATKLAVPKKHKGQRYLTEDALTEAQVECNRGQQWAHKHVMNCYQVAVIPSPYPNMYEGIYMVMEDSGKMNLNQAAQKGLISIHAAAQIIWQTISGLNYIRSNFDHIHHDMKSDNIMLRDPESGDFYVKVIDLGGAESCVYQGNAGTGVGTPFYAPPEWPAQRFIHGLCDSFDVFALGIMLRDAVFSKYQDQKRIADQAFTPGCFTGDVTRCSFEHVKLHFPRLKDNIVEDIRRALPNASLSSWKDFWARAPGLWIPYVTDGSLTSREYEMLAKAAKFMFYTTQPSGRHRGSLSTIRNLHDTLFLELFPQPVPNILQQPPMQVELSSPAYVRPAKAGGGRPQPAGGAKHYQGHIRGGAQGAAPHVLGADPKLVFGGAVVDEKPLAVGAEVCTETVLLKEWDGREYITECEMYVNPKCSHEHVRDIRIMCELVVGWEYNGQGVKDRYEFVVKRSLKRGDRKFSAQCRGSTVSKCVVVGETRHD